MAQPRRDPLAHAHGNEEVGDREALLGGGDPRHRRDRVGHRSPRAPALGRPGVRRSLPTATGRTNRGLDGWRVPSRRQSPRTAATIERRPAIRAGCAAASIASPTPATSDSDDRGPTAARARRRAARRRTRRAATPTPIPATEPTIAPIRPRIPASTSTLRQTWRRLMPGGAQHAQLADPLPGVHRERVDDAQARRRRPRPARGGRAGRTRGRARRRGRPRPARSGATVRASWPASSRDGGGRPSGCEPGS